MSDRTIQDEAEALFGNAFFNLTTRRTEIKTLLGLIRSGLPRAEHFTHKRNQEHARQVFEDPAYEKYFLDKSGFRESVGGPDGLSRLMTAGDLSVLRTFVNEACLVFMHSALDAAVSDLCRACSLVAPHDWELFIGSKKVAFSEIKGSDYEGLLRGRLAEHVDDLSRESVVRRIDRLFEICKKPSRSGRPNYTYSRGRLEAIDRERNDVIHGDGAELADINERLDYLLETGLYLVEMVNERYDLRMDPLKKRKARSWSKVALPGTE